VREYPAATVAAARLVSYNVSQMYPVSDFDVALPLGGFGVIEYFLGGFNRKKENLLDARTVPFMMLPPAAAGGWVARMALAPSKFPGGSKVPEPLDNVTIVPLGAGALTLAVQSFEWVDAPTGAELDALCTDAKRAVGKGALPGYGVDAASPFAAGIYALYYGRSTGPFFAECWLGVAKSRGD